MVHSKTNTLHLLTFVIPLLVILSSLAIALSPILEQHPEIATAITYDLTFTAPLVYFLLIRKRKISKLTVVPVFVLGIVLGTFLLPEDNQHHLGLIKTYALPLVEFLVLSLVVFNINKTIKTFKKHATKIDDFYLLANHSAKEVIGTGRVAHILASEISLFYYGFFSWKRKEPNENEFTNYKDNGAITMLWAFFFIILIETTIFHLLLQKWSPIAAWVLTASSIYTALMIFGHIKALTQRLSIIKTDSLTLKNGLISTVGIDLNVIEKVELFSSEDVDEGLKAGSLGISKKSTNHNVALYFNRPQIIEKAYGMKQECDVLLFYIDDKNRFIEKLGAVI